MGKVGQSTTFECDECGKRETVIRAEGSGVRDQPDGWFAVYASKGAGPEVWHNPMVAGLCCSVPCLAAWGAKADRLLDERMREWEALNRQARERSTRNYN